MTSRRLLALGLLVVAFSCARAREPNAPAEPGVATKTGACDPESLGPLFTRALRASTNARFTVEVFADESQADAPDLPLDERHRAAFGARFATVRPDSYHQVFVSFEARRCSTCSRYTPSQPESLGVGPGGAGYVITFATSRFRVRLGNSELLGEGDPPQDIDLTRLGERIFTALNDACS